MINIIVQCITTYIYWNETSFRTAVLFFPNTNRLNIWQLNNLSSRLKDNYQSTNFFPQPTPQLRVELWESDWE